MGRYVIKKIRHYTRCGAVSLSAVSALKRLRLPSSHQGITWPDPTSKADKEEGAI